MLREPYNLNPYNSTIDTSLVQPFSFVFSGDKLGAYQIQIAENNAKNNILYTSDIVVLDPPAYNGERVEATLPNIVQTNIDRNDGRIYYVYTLTDASVITGTDYILLSTSNQTTFTTENSFRVDLFKVDGNNLLILLETGIGINNIPVYYQCFSKGESSPLGNITFENKSASFSYYQLRLDNRKNPFNIQSGQTTDFIPYRVQIKNIVFQISGTSTLPERAEDKNYLYINLYNTEENQNKIVSPDAYFVENDGFVIYYLYLAAKLAPLQALVGRDLVWRVIQWEEITWNSSSPPTITGAKIENFVRNGQLIAKIITDGTLISSDLKYEIGALMPVLENYVVYSYNGHDATYTRHCLINNNIETQVQLRNVEGVPTLFIPFSYTYGVDLSEHSDKFAYAVIDNIYCLTGKITVDQENFFYKVPLTYKDEDGRTLINNAYYNYELIMKNGKEIDSFDETVTYTVYIPNLSNNPCPKFGTVIYNNGLPIFKQLAQFTYVEYSNGNVRGYTNALGSTGVTIPPAGTTYQLYSNFFNSNWFFFESRTLPVVVPQYYNDDDGQVAAWADLPGNHYKKRALKVSATYMQENLIPLRYYRWTFYNDQNELLDDSGEIYNSTLTYTLSPLTQNGTYRVKLTTVSQSNVVVEKESSISTSFSNTYDPTNKGEFIKDEHYIKVGWEADLSAMPAEESVYDKNGFGNRISVTDQYKDFALLNNNETLIYNTISGSSFAIEQNSFALRIGFVIEDNLEEYTQGQLIQFGFTSRPISLRKDGYVFSLDNNSTDLLNRTFGISDNPEDTAHVGEWLLWLEGTPRTAEECWWEEGLSDEPKYWVETSSNTNVYYYELIIYNNNSQSASVKLYRTPFMRGRLEISSTNNNNDINIPYNSLLYGNSSIKGRFGVSNGAEKNNVSLTGGDFVTMTLQGTDVPSISSDYVVYGAEESRWNGATVNSWVSSLDFSSINFNPKIYLFYTQISQKYNQNIIAPLGFGNKPSWENWEENQGDPTGQFMVLTFNDTLQSHKMATEEGTTISEYEVYRIKYPSEEEAENDENQIYMMFVGKVNLAENENLNASARIFFHDYTVENNGYYRYLIIPTGLTDGKYFKSMVFHTDWEGWSFMSIQPEGNHYTYIDRWIYLLNLESKGYSHVTNKVFHQGFNRYPKVSVGVTDYITSDMTGLIGEFHQIIDEEKKIYYNSYSNDNIERIYQWENFINDGHKILVKDYKGRAYIAQLDGNAMSFQDVASEILTTTSFNITQIDDVGNYPIFKVEGER